MDHKRLIEQIKTSFENLTSLPLTENEMIPFDRRKRNLSMAQNPNPRLSAVMILLYPDNGTTHTALILRSTYNGTHSAQVSFPGGKMDETDLDLETTAKRELFEEVGIPEEDIEILGHLNDVYIPPSGFLVKPFIGYLNYTPSFSIDPREVAELIEAPLITFLDDSIMEQGEVQRAKNGMKIIAPYFNVKGHKVWGATAVMLYELKHYLLTLQSL